MSQLPSFFLSVGEPSGDLLGSELLKEMQKRLPHFHSFGIAGPCLRENPQFEALASIEDLSVMGFVEVIKHLRYIKRLEDRLLKIIEERKPAFAILVDYPGFHMRLAEFLRARGVYVIQYVAPQLWAWGEGRTKKLKEVTDLVVGIMPFEKEFFLDRSVNFAYAGTPQADRAARTLAQKYDFGWKSDVSLYGIFPGSRRGEVQRLLPLLRKTVDHILNNDEKAHCAISIAPALAPEVFLPYFSELTGHEAKLNTDSDIHCGRVSFIKGRSLALMSQVRSAVVTSGTATLECALVKTPLCIAYRMNKLSYQIAKRIISLENISLVNLVAGKKIVREFIQEFSAIELAEELLALATPGKYRSQVLNNLNELDGQVSGDLARNGAKLIVETFLQGNLNKTSE